MYNLENIKTTEQEIEILELLSNGLRAFDIAQRMNLAEQTIKNKQKLICLQGEKR